MIDQLYSDSELRNQQDLLYPPNQQYRDYPQDDRITLKEVRDVLVKNFKYIYSLTDQIQVVENDSKSFFKYALNRKIN